MTYNHDISTRLTLDRDGRRETIYLRESFRSVLFRFRTGSKARVVEESDTRAVIECGDPIGSSVIELEKT